MTRARSCWNFVERLVSGVSDQAYIKEAHKMSQIYSDLHQTIQDKFNEAGIEIMSPHYMAVRDGNATTTPKDDLSKSNTADTASQSNKSE